MTDVAKERWQAAQVAERRFHNETFDAGYAHYKQSYEQYFRHLGIDADLKGLSIVEIGPADFPALAYCKNAGPNSAVIEPMPSDHLKKFGITIIIDLAEVAEYSADEVWLFNVLQHVVNPYKIVERAKKQANVVRFFEPLNYGVDECHPWNLTMDMFKEWFGEIVNYYPAGQPVQNFHTWECAYGVWIK